MRHSVVTYLIPVLIAGALLAAASGCGSSTEPEPGGPTPVEIVVPGFPAMPHPADNPLTQEGIHLGRLLFYDPVLSADSTLACGGCHQPQAAFADTTGAVSVGVHGENTRRNAPGLTNLAWYPSFFWDGRAATLEEQAIAPVESTVEMDLPWPQAVARLQAHPTYPDLFQAAFGTRTVTQDLTVKAIAQFQRTLVSYNSRYDRWLRGEVELTFSEIRGFFLFFTEKADCFHCHGKPLFTDLDFRNNGLDSEFVDRGREEATLRPEDIGKFKSPSLRNVELTPPYMHDGRFDTLEEAVQHYNSGGVGSPTVDPLIRVNQGLGMNPAEVADVVAFLKALTDTSFINNPDFQNPFQ